MIERMDQNADGKLSTDELPEPLRERMANADTNGDGFIDLAELTTAMAALRGGGARPGSEPAVGHELRPANAPPRGDL